MRLLVVTAVYLLATPDDGKLELPERLSTFLDSGKWDSTPASFRIIALSHLADGCAGQARAEPARREAAKKCVEQVIARARATTKGRAEDHPDGLWLTHFNLVLGAADAVGECPDAAEHARISKELARRSLADPLRHAPSYAKVTLRWPADQAATLASLARYDAAHLARPSTPLRGEGATPLGDEVMLDAPMSQWRDLVTTRFMHATLGLPVSEVTGRGPGAAHPRGCAQSYISRYLAEADPKLSAKWWAAYRDAFFVRYGSIVGFREWPRGVERKGDVDSGPIIFGIGTAASAFAIAAAKAQGDELLALQLESNANMVLSTGAGGSAATNLLAEAIRFQGKWQPRLVE